MIDVKKEMKLCSPMFITAKRPDKHAAAIRYGTTERIMEEWFLAINQTNTRGLPEDLIKAYDEAAIAMGKIIAGEKELIIGKEDTNEFELP